MKFAIHRTRKDCVVPTSALAVAGLKRQKDLRLEVENGVIVLLRPEMNAKKLLAVSTFLHDLASEMVAAVALECGECSCCGDCPGKDDVDCECDYCESREQCCGIEIPDCLLDKAGIGRDQGLQADVEDGAVIIRALDDEVSGDNLACDEDADPFPEEVPDALHCVFIENDVCIPRLREMLCDNTIIPF